MNSVDYVCVKVSMRGTTHIYRFSSFADAVFFIDALNLCRSAHESILYFSFSNSENGKSQKGRTE